MSTEYKRVRDYELMVIFHPELSEEDLASESGKVEGHITSVEGSIRLINREAPWGRRRLAYPIRHGSRDVRDGVYVLYYFTSESGKLNDIEREIKLQDPVLRYLLTQQSAPVMEPAPAEEESAEGEAEAEVVTASAQAAPAEQKAEPETVASEVEQVEEATEVVEPTTAEASGPTEPEPSDTAAADGSEEAPAAPDSVEETPA